MENAPKQALVLPNYVVPVAAVLLIIVAVIALPKILGHRSDSSSSASTTTAATTAPAKPAEQPARREVAPVAKPSPASDSRNSLKAPAEKKPVAPPRSSSVAQPNNSPVAAPTPASVRTGSFPPANAPSAPSSSSASSARGEVLDQILPEASPGALATIHGVVRVGVRVQVDPSGAVSDAALDSPGPSKYFADLALQAARRWQFTSPEAGGHSIPSEWLIRFQFMPSGPKAIPTQTAP